MVTDDPKALEKKTNNGNMLHTPMESDTGKWKLEVMSMTMTELVSMNLKKKFDFEN